MTINLPKEGYLPIPVWMNGHYDPVMICDAGAIGVWPEGFDPSTLPIPPYNIHEWVRFHFGSEIMTGEIVEITLRGGTYRYPGFLDNEPQTAEELLAQRYLNLDSMRFSIYAQGHNRYATLKDIIRSEAPLL